MARTAVPRTPLPRTARLADTDGLPGGRPAPEEPSPRTPAPGEPPTLGRIPRGAVTGGR